jgi:peptidoglycan L-alanyl-D-glutamate endopeptidase CwlK
MIFAFGQTSRDRLATCDERLQRVFNEVIKHRDCSILCGHRGQAEQDEALRTGKSKLGWPKSNHNTLPSKAVDVAPYPIDWTDIDRFRLFAGFVLGVAAGMGIPLRWGGDWDGDGTNRDQSFHDLPHFEVL